MAFLVAATSVTVLVVNSIERPEHGGEPGADIALDLARHGAFVHVAGMASNHAPIAQVMFAEAVHNGSDLLVIGSYSHARWRELLFGGTTRTLLTETLVPVLVSK